MLFLQTNKTNKQNKQNNCSCENKRTMELFVDVGHRPIVFIRFNPDEYDRSNDTHVTSCWGQNSKGICVVKKSKREEWEYRLSVLHEAIVYWSYPEHCTNKTIEIVQLFFDV